MDLVNMKCDSKENDFYSEPTALADKPEYPYGLQVTLDEDSLQKLGISQPFDVGQNLMMLAKVEVCSVSQYENQKEEKKLTISLQITDMNLKKAEPDPKSPEETFYGNA